MTNLTIDQFDGYFKALHGHPPYDWQQRLAARVMKGDWPRAIDLPTGSGKTACIDVAVFALASQAVWQVHERAAPRRVFFCVNRRVIVDEAYQRAARIAKRIWEAERNGAIEEIVLRQVAEALRKLAGTTSDDDAPPLDVLELRGGIYRDNRWARSAMQPTIVCTTVDQLGSRLLFRGYGVSTNAAPIQAALIAYGSLILLDEAHISRPFLQTLQNTRQYLNPSKWTEQDIGVPPVIVVPMTATLPDDVTDSDMIRLSNEDRKNDSLNRRLTANKPAILTTGADVANTAVESAEELTKGKPVAIGIIVNRVAVAKAIYSQLRKAHPDSAVELVIGSMRPIDRDEQSRRLRPLVGPDRPKLTEKTSFVVATQCLEVGADYDFDALVTECASLDALRQRFGRLNRAGRQIETRAVIVAARRDLKPENKLDDAKPLDPIYGNAAARTWNWLFEHATVLVDEPSEEAGTASKRVQKAKAGNEVRQIDFGIDAFNGLIEQCGEGGRIPPNLFAPSASLDAPVMLPAYIDFWCQTAPKPSPDPDVSLFIHGPQRGEPDVQVCWRADLIQDDCMNSDDWCDVVALLPPTAAECMSVPISRVRRWLSKPGNGIADHGDLLGVAEEDDNADEKNGKPDVEKSTLRYVGVLWRGAKDSRLIQSADDLWPGDTLVLPVLTGGWDELGHIPEPADSPQAVSEVLLVGTAESPNIDVAESAFQLARGRAVLRLHPALRPYLPEKPSIITLLDRVADPDNPATLGELRELIKEAAATIEGALNHFSRTLKLLANCRGIIQERYPDERGVVLTTRNRIVTATGLFLPPLDDGDDEPSRTRRDDPISLVDHTEHVCDAIDRVLLMLPTTELAGVLCLAAKLHDMGKADERFQAMLRRTDRTDAWLLIGVISALLAKSDGLPQTRTEREAARVRAGLPNGFRHEMLSVQLAQRAAGLPADRRQRDLVLHLIAAHHGHARPFAPVVLDDDPPDVEVDGISIAAKERKMVPPHRLDSGIAERFWSLTHRFGWWGLAYLEAILRLADQQASSDEDAGRFDNANTHQPAEANA